MALNLTLSNRLHEIIRQTSIRTINEALVELVTNADDAYRTTNISRKDIWIELVRNNDLTDVIVIDQAIGMKYEDMISNLLTVGNYTATDSSRGMMGRGAKDCSFLGDITFTCIRDGIMNQLVIYQNRTADFLQENVTVTDDIRKKYGINVNGCNVKLSVNNSLVSTNEALKTSLSNNIYLRKILQDDSMIVLLQEKAVNFNERLKYIDIPGTLIVSCDYDIPEYNTTAHLEIYKTSEEIPMPQKPDEIQYGISVSSNNSVYECSALYHIATGVQDYMWSPNIRYITGKLICNDIDRIAREAANGNISSLNPYLLIDPNRRAGLVRDHPFTIALYSHAYHLLSIIIARIQDTRDDLLLDNGNANDVFDSLNEMLSNMLPPESVLYTWRTRENQEQLNKIASSLKNVNMDDQFMGLKWEDLQNLINNKSLVIDQQQIQNNFKLGFTNDPNLKTPYQILYFPGQVSLKINTNDPSIKDYISVEDGKVTLVNVGKALTSAGSIVLDATNNMIMRRNIMSGKTSSIDINGFNEYTFNVTNIRQTLAPNIFSRVLNGINTIKSSGTTTTLDI